MYVSKTAHNLQLVFNTLHKGNQILQMTYSEAMLCWKG